MRPALIPDSRTMSCIEVRWKPSRAKQAPAASRICRRRAAKCASSTFGTGAHLPKEIDLKHGGARDPKGADFKHRCPPSEGNGLRHGGARDPKGADFKQLRPRSGRT